MEKFMQYNNIFHAREREVFTYSLSLSLSLSLSSLSLITLTVLKKCLLTVILVEQSPIVKQMCLQCFSDQFEMFGSSIFSTGKKVIVGFIQSAT